MNDCTLYFTGRCYPHPPFSIILLLIIQAYFLITIDFMHDQKFFGHKNRHWILYSNAINQIVLHYPLTSKIFIIYLINSFHIYNERWMSIIVSAQVKIFLIKIHPPHFIPQIIGFYVMDFFFQPP